MSKFKVGDRVEIVSSNSRYNGLQGIIQDIDFNWDAPYLFKCVQNNKYYQLKYNELKLIENNEHQCSKNVHEFKNNDQVIVDCEKSRFHGLNGVVKKTANKMCLVYFESLESEFPMFKTALKIVNDSKKDEQNMNTNEHITNITQSLEKLREQNQKYREQLAYVVGQLSQHVDMNVIDFYSDLKSSYNEGVNSERTLQQQLTSGCLSFDEYKETRKKQINKILQVLKE